MNKLRFQVGKLLLFFSNKLLKLFGLPDIINFKKILISRHVYDTFDGVIKEGPFSGVILPNRMSWGSSDQASMILGLYEREVMDVITSLDSSISIFVDIGAADGYYAVSSIKKNIFSKAICYELTKQGRQVIKENAILNDVEKNIEIRGQASSGFFNEIECHDLEKSFFLMDIEGAEFDLLDEKALNKLRKSHLLIELHAKRVEQGELKLKNLLSMATRYFATEIIETSSRDPYKSIALKEANLSDNEVWILCAEGRKKRGKWLYLIPKNAN